MEKKLIGKITHFFPKASGDKISIEKGEEAFEQVVDSMQIEHEKIEEAKAGDAIGLKVKQPVKEGADVFKVME